MTDLLEPVPELAGGDDAEGWTDVAPRSRLRERYWPPTPQQWATAEAVATVVCIVSAVWIVVGYLHPSQMLANTTPAGGDMGAHVWGPAYLRDHILPHWRLSGWAPDWYGGFPMYQFYMVPPALLVVLLNVVLPYGVSLKLVSVLGMATLPVSLWFFGKMAGLRFPVPQLFAFAGVVFLFDDSFTIYGGNIASTMAGEFSFSIALSVAFVFFGVFVNGLRTGRRRAWAAALAALASLSHGIVLPFVAIGATALFALYADRKRWRYFWPVALVAFLLAAFWLLPFQFRHGFGTDMFYERRPVGNVPHGTDLPDSYWQMFWIDWVIMVTAMVGLVGAAIRRSKPGIFVGLVMIGYWGWAWLWPQSLLWNARLLPFMYLARYLLVALGVVELGRGVARLLRPYDMNVRRAAGLGTAAVGLVGTLLIVGVHLQRLPFGSTHVVKVKGTDTWVWDWGPFRVKQSDRGFVDGWAKWNYDGYERKQAYGEYYGILYAMQNLGKERGCGRALWENNNDIDKYGTPMALMLLPFWTDGCIGSMEGLYFEASGTTPYHFLMAAAASKHSSNPVRRLEYEDGDLAKGVTYMQTLGVRYYMAYQPEMVTKAEAEPRLTELVTSGPWHVYEVADTALVEPLTTQPVVVTGEDLSNRDRWLELGTSWFQHRDLWPAMPVASGPADWARVGLQRTGEKKTTNSSLARVAPAINVAPVALPAVTVTDTRTGDDFVSFHVDKVGVPVLVKTSYFPNWKVSGAKGPYRVAPNLMVVVPTSNDVRLHYGYTGLDLFSYALTLLGLLGLVLLWRLGPVRMTDPAPAIDAPVDDAADEAHDPYTSVRDEPTGDASLGPPWPDVGADDATPTAALADPPPWTRAAPAAVDAPPGPSEPDASWAPSDDGREWHDARLASPPPPAWAQQPPVLPSPLPPPRPEADP
jgi:hypothetical protein